MTLKVTKIVDEMIDLETGQQYSHGIVVSNGIREEFIPLAKESLEPLVALYVEGVKARSNGSSEVVVAPAQPRQQVQAQPRQKPTQPKTALIDSTNKVEFTPKGVEEPEQSFEPGEQYVDDLGVSSF